MTADDPDRPSLEGSGFHYADDDWSIFTAAERLEAEIAVTMAFERKQASRELAREIATIKAMQKAGLPVRRAVVDGIAVEFGQPEHEPAASSSPSPADPTANPWDSIYAAN
jgi:hypothetical protein